MSLSVSDGTCNNDGNFVPTMPMQCVRRETPNSSIEGVAVNTMCLAQCSGRKGVLPSLAPMHNTVQFTLLRKANERIYSVVFP
eukprot:2862311-Amphidinium_carterae.3